MLSLKNLATLLVLTIVCLFIKIIPAHAGIGYQTIYSPPQIQISVIDGVEVETFLPADIFLETASPALNLSDRRELALPEIELTVEIFDAEDFSETKSYAAEKINPPAIEAPQVSVTVDELPVVQEKFSPPSQFLKFSSPQITLTTIDGVEVETFYPAENFSEI